jgi:hypothetical protein
MLKSIGLYNPKEIKLNCLEIGAINTQLQKYKGLNVRAIDINSQVNKTFLIIYIMLLYQQIY